MPALRCVIPPLPSRWFEPARERLAATGLTNVELLKADAQTHAFPAGSFDVIISRFGLMFFEDPQAAFGNLARALRPGGRLVFVCPEDPLDSEWIAVALGAAGAVLGQAPDPGAPGRSRHVRVGRR